MNVADRQATAGAGPGGGGLLAPGTTAGGLTTDALLLDEHLTLRMGRRELAFPRVGEALVRVSWAGVCGSDLHVLRTGEWVAYWPATLGHEVVGVVQDCPGAEVPAGTAVVVDSRLPCRKCQACQQAAYLCENMSWLGEGQPGGFARHLVVPVTSLVPCPPQLEPAIAVLAEPLAVAMHAVSSLARRPENVLVLGYGPIGALVHLELARRWAGLPVSVSEIFEPRRQLALALGARLTASPSGPEDGVNTSVSGRPLFSLVVDTAGYPQSLLEACGGAANGGTVLVVALSFDAVTMVPAELVQRALTISGSVGFDDELEDALVVLASHPDRYRPLITEAVLLEEAVERLAALSSEPSAGKVLLRPWSE